MSVIHSRQSPSVSLKMALGIIWMIGFLFYILFHNFLLSIWKCREVPEMLQVPVVWNWCLFSATGMSCFQPSPASNLKSNTKRGWSSQGKRTCAYSVILSVCNRYFLTTELNCTVGRLDNWKVLCMTFPFSSISEILNIYLMELHHHFCNQAITMALFSPSLQ